jgi:hypothetical protein
MCICECNAKLLGLARIMEAGTTSLVFGKPELIMFAYAIFSEGSIRREWTNAQ